MSQILGVDFGGTNSVLMTVKGGHTVCVLNGESKRQTPVVVVMGAEERMIGTNGQTAWNRNYKSALSELKRWVGLKKDDPEVEYEKKFLSIKDDCIKVNEETGKIEFSINYLGNKTTVTPELAYGMMIGSLVDLAAKDSKRDVKNARDKFHVVLSVPPYFNNAQRQAVLDACKIARVQCLRIINDNTASCLKYAFQEQRSLDAEKDTNIMVIDFGHSDFTCSIAACRPKSVTMLAQSWDKQLGGREVDMMLCDFFAKQAKPSQGNPMETEKQKLKLRKGAIKAKKVICSGVTDAICSVECLFPESNYPDFRGKISKQEFEDMTSPLLDRALPVIEETLKKANMKPEDLLTVELIGGASRMPMFKQKIMKYFEGKTKVTTTLNADECIAEGCCLQAAILSPSMRCIPWSVKDCVSYPVKLTFEQEDADEADMEEETENTEEVAASGKEVALFSEGDHVPCTRRVTFKRTNGFKFQFYENENMVGEGVIGELPPVEQAALDAGKSKKRKIAINGRYDINGIVSVASAEYKKYVLKEKKKPVPEQKESKDTAAPTPSESSEEPVEKEMVWKEKRTDLGFQFDRSYGIKGDVLSNLIQTELEMCQSDWSKQEKDEARNTCEDMCYRIKEYFEEDGELFKFEKEELRQAATTFADESEEWIYDDDDNEYTTKDFLNKTAELQAKVQPALDRQREHKERPTAQSMLIGKVEEYRRVANSTMLIYEHLTQEERDSIRSKCSECQDWVYAKMEEQGKKELYEDPSLTANDIRQKRQELIKHCQPIANRPKPVKKAEEKEPEKKAEEKEPKTEDEKPMETEQAEKPEGDMEVEGSS